MIELTRLNKKKFHLNHELIETVESTPDTVVTLRNGKLLIVMESPEEISEMVLNYRRSQYSELLRGVLNSMARSSGNPPQTSGTNAAREG